MGMKELVAVIFGLGLGCNALLFVPQVVALWRKKSDAGISLVTFGGFSVLAGGGNRAWGLPARSLADSGHGGELVDLRLGYRADNFLQIEENTGRESGGIRNEVSHPFHLGREKDRIRVTGDRLLRHKS